MRKRDALMDLFDRLREETDRLSKKVRHLEVVSEHSFGKVRPYQTYAYEKLQEQIYGIEDSMRGARPSEREHQKAAVHSLRQAQAEVMKPGP
jgi:hypothetical protein